MEYRIQKPDELYHYGVKGMRWGVRKSKGNFFRGKHNRFAQKARRQATYNKRVAQKLTDRGNDYDDQEAYRLASPKEKARSRANAKRLVQNSLNAADYWQKAASSLDKTTSYREGKHKYKEYRNYSIRNYGYVINP